MAQYPLSPPMVAHVHYELRRRKSRQGSECYRCYGPFKVNDQNIGIKQTTKFLFYIFRCCVWRLISSSTALRTHYRTSSSYIDRERDRASSAASTLFVETALEWRSLHHITQTFVHGSVTSSKKEIKEFEDTSLIQKQTRDLPTLWFQLFNHWWT
jgi:hypothetical protein